MTFVVSWTAQSSHGGPRWAAAPGSVVSLIILLAAAPSAGAQTGQVGGLAAAFHAEPGGVRIGTLLAGETVRTEAARAAYTRLTIEGWIFRASVGPETREGYNLRVIQAPEENLRAEPNGRIVARLVQGALLNEVERRGNWVKVTRTGWTPTASLAPPPRATAAARRDSAAIQPVPQTADPRRGVVRRRMELFRAPDSAAIGTLEAGLPVRVTGRAGGWIRIEAQGWVRESEIRMSDVSILAGITAAELRAAPEEFRGRLLRWTIQYLALQTADDLRPDFAPGQRYILARGPGPEYAFVYIIIPADKLPEVRRLEPLASVTVVARVLAGRSAYLANPILELVELQ
jgi:hypothetical protein